MATGKRYHWIKLSDKMLTSDAVDFLMGQTNGANYVVLYQLLLLKTINTGGRLARQIGDILIPYDVEKIARDCKWFSEDTVRVALTLYCRLGLIYEAGDGILEMVDHAKMVGSETDYAQQKRIQRETRQQLIDGQGVDNVHDMSAFLSTEKSTQRKSIEKEYRERGVEIDIDTDTSLIDINNITTQQAYVEDNEYSVSLRVKPQITLILADGSTTGPQDGEIERLKAAFPSVDIEAEFYKAAEWLRANPDKRPAIDRVSAFIFGWMRKATREPQPTEQRKKVDRKGNQTYGGKPDPATVHAAYQRLLDEEQEELK